MKAPVWYLIMRVSEVAGGQGWHRSYLIDQAIKHFNEWWLLGTAYCAHWMPYGHPLDPNKVDITNQYIAEGVNGGLLTMVLFIAVIVCCFQAIGLKMREIEKRSFEYKFLVWALGCSLFSHAVNFLSVAYFDQIFIFWYLTLALVASLQSKRENKTI
jgi:O-antigen ligase